jgi:hypothetical protein
MIDGIRRRPNSGNLHPRDQHLAGQVVVGGQHDNKPYENKSFTPPETVAAKEEEKPAASTTGSMVTPPPKKRRSFKDWLQARTKKQWIICGIIAAVLLIGGGTAAYFLMQDTPVKTVSKAKPVPPKPVPTTEASKLTGLQVGFEVNKRPVTGVMIENSVDARPQSGLDQAGVVFEAIAEGGITRFLALFQDNMPDYIGPVRSVRPYYLEWLLGFDAPIAHVGGSPAALQDIKTWGVKDLDQFYNGGSYHRITSRYAPHNVYTSMAELADLESKKGFTSSNFVGFARKAETPSKTPNAKSIDLNIASAPFNVHYDYDAATNSYKRNVGGQIHNVIDKSGAQTQLAPKVVVALVLQQGIDPDGQHTAYTVVGSGHAYIFQDGVVTEGTWTKKSRTDNITFTDMNGKELKLNPGQTWLSAVGGSDRVIYKP